MGDVLTQAQLSAVNHRNGSLLIAAAAGSGKTKVLVERLMARITEPDSPDIDDFLVITFTRAAAAELRERISSELTARLAMEPSSRRLRRQLSLVSRAHICTIDSFCAEIVRSNAHVLDIRPDFRIAEELESKLLHSGVLSQLLEQKYNAMTPEFEALASAMNSGRDDTELENTIAETYSALQAHAYPMRWIEERLNDRTDYSDAGESVWGAELLKNAMRKTGAAIREMTESRALLTACPAAEKAYGENWEDAADTLKAYMEALKEGWDTAVRFGRPSFKRLNPLKSEYKEDPAVAAAIRKRKACSESMKSVASLFDADSSVHASEMEKMKTVTDELLRTVMEFDSMLAEEKKRRGILEYSDIEHLAVRLLVAENGESSERAREIASGFAEILVDEYQDVSGVQDMIFRAVSRNGENLVLVGDVKQSIYRFRLADPTIFLQKYNAWADDPEPGMPKRILLSQNFRSRPGVLDAVNGLFSQIMTPELGEMRYGEDEALKGGGHFPESSEPAFELLLLDRPSLPEDKEATEAEAELVAQKIRAILSSGMTVKGRPVEPGDIAVLMRSLKTKGEIFTEVLRREGIPVLSQSDGAAGETDVAAVLAFLSVIDNPRQDVALIAVLRSVLFGFTADELAEIRAEDKKSDFYTALSAHAATDAKCAGFMNTLLRYRLAAPELGLERLLRMIFDESGITAASDSGGLYALLDAARAFEARGGAGLYGFVSQIRETEESGEAFTLPVARAAGTGVTVTTIHASKGLEWPVVFVAGLSSKFNLADEKKTLLIHRDLGIGPYYYDTARRIKYPTLAREAIKARLRNETLSEEMRLLYVAMTRAEEKLLLVTSPVKGADEWKKLTEEDDEPDASALEKCGNMGEWVLRAAVRLAKKDAGWEPRILIPGESGTVSAEDGQTEHETDGSLAERIRERIAFSPPERDAWRIPSKITATELKGGALENEAAEDAESFIKKGHTDFRRPVFETERGRLSPTERGTALHKAVQFSKLEECSTVQGAESEIERLREKHMLSGAEADSVNPGDLTALAQSSLGRRMVSAQEIRHEFKFSVLIPADELLERGGRDELLLQGVVDCIFDEGKGLVVVDFKSDAVTKLTQAAAAKRYAPQLEAYAKAMERIYKRPVIEKLLYFFRTGETVRV